MGNSSSSTRTPMPNGPRIVEIVGNQEYPLPQNEATHVTFFNDYNHGPRIGRFFMQTPDVPFIETELSSTQGSDPWMVFRNNRPQPVTPLFTPEVYNEQVSQLNRWSTPLLPLNGPPAQLPSSSSSQDPIVPKALPNVPMWAMMENATAARGSLQWNPAPKARIEAPKVYRDEIDIVEPMHERIIENFRNRRTPEQFVCEFQIGIYQNHDSRMYAHQ